MYVCGFECRCLWKTKASEFHGTGVKWRWFWVSLKIKCWSSARLLRSWEWSYLSIKEFSSEMLLYVANVHCNEPVMRLKYKEHRTEENVHLIRERSRESNVQWTLVKLLVHIQLASLPWACHEIRISGI